MSDPSAPLARCCTARELSLSSQVSREADWTRPAGRLSKGAPGHGSSSPIPMSIPAFTLVSLFLFRACFLPFLGLSSAVRSRAGRYTTVRSVVGGIREVLAALMPSGAASLALAAAAKRASSPRIPISASPRGFISLSPLRHRLGLPRIRSSASLGRVAFSLLLLE